jgi:hypothetical protein
MSKPNRIDAAEVHEMLMGLSRMTGSAMMADIAKVVGDLAPDAFANALNSKQMASKLWLIDRLQAHLGSSFAHIIVMGGWHGVLSALLLNDVRFSIGRITSVDLDPACEPVALLLNRRFAAEARFHALTADMYDLDASSLGLGENSLVINTSCEHIPDLRAWLDTLPRGQLVLLQSNDYRIISEHISCVSSVDELAQLAGLSELVSADALPGRNYTRFMVMGRT